MSEPDEVRDLLPAWALDAVDDVERARVERALREDPELAAEAQALRETAARLAAGSAVPPPARLRSEVLDAVAATPQEETGREGTGSASRVAGTRRSRGAPREGQPARGRPWARWAVAAAIVVAAAVPGTIAVQQYQRAEQAETYAAELGDALARPGAELVQAQVTGGGEATAVLAADGGVFLADQLPELGDDQDYQLWVIEPDAISSAGVLEIEGGRASAEVAALGEEAVLGLTVEPAGGSPQPTSDPIVTLAGG